eukprot:scaffold83925_cov66-Phaeocystis_antarctica.AAC.1
MRRGAHWNRHGSCRRGRPACQHWSGSNSRGRWRPAFGQRQARVVPTPRCCWSGRWCGYQNGR